MLEEKGDFYPSSVYLHYRTGHPPQVHKEVTGYGRMACHPSGKLYLCQKGDELDESWFVGTHKTDLVTCPGCLRSWDYIEQQIEKDMKREVEHE